MLTGSLTTKIIISMKNYVYKSKILVIVRCPNDGFLDNDK